MMLADAKGNPPRASSPLLSFWRTWMLPCAREDWLRLPAPLSTRRNEGALSKLKILGSKVGQGVTGDPH